MSDAETSLLIERATPRIGRTALRAFAETLRRDLCGGRPFTCLLTGDKELRRLNRQFLGHAYATDVLSFPSGEPIGPLGDIAISLERAKAQAAEYGHRIEQEVRILLLHGVLHLLGHDHEADQGEMRRLEERWREKYELPTGVIERAGA
ncbi:MAG: rRNA maturation RNase YbeY [Bryobacteraceae bacterium]|nr:rRNA maturation RNase YbeY [Bryobacteraceae bacterium]